MTAALVEHLWQSTLFVIGAALLTLVLRKDEARVRYWVWFAASLKFLIPFSLLTALGSQFVWREASASAPVLAPSFVEFLGRAADPFTAEITMRATAVDAFPLGAVLLAVWGIGCAALLARWLLVWMRIHITLREATPAAMAAPIPVKTTPVLSEPGVVGILRPVLLMPAGIAERLTPAQLQAVLTHELCHVRRRDNLTAAVHMVLEAVFWFHPFIWWIGARLVEERERACDEAVVELGNERQTYAESILKVCQFYMESRLTCVAGVAGGHLRKRVEVIMNHRIRAGLSAAKKVLLGTAVATTLAAPVVVGLLLSPEGSVSAAASAEPAPLTFDSVAISKAATEGQVWLFNKDGRFVAQRVPLRAVISFAYGVDGSRVVGGPEWLDQPLYDVVGNSSHELAMKQGNVAYARMMKAMLADRFALLTHPEKQTLPAFALRVHESGSKLTHFATNVRPDPTFPGQLIARPDLLLGMQVELKLLVGFLANRLGRPVIDETGLEGRFDFTLKGALTNENLPVALREQLGLTLEPATSAVDVIVVDQVLQPTLDAPAAAKVN
jgi:bla regulator protein BlaR1